MAHHFDETNKRQPLFFETGRSSAEGHTEILGLGFGVAGTHHVRLGARKMMGRMGRLMGRKAMDEFTPGARFLRGSQATFAPACTPLSFNSAESFKIR